MIRIIPIQEAYKKKIERQQNLKGLTFKCYGSCAFVGKDVSPGCYGCFYPDAYHHGFILGKDLGLPNVCNKDCVYCFEPHVVHQSAVFPDGFKMGEGWRDIMAANLEEEKQKITTDCKMQYYEFTGICEPLLYLPVIEELMGFYRNIVDPFMGTKGWAKLYTNGILLNLDNILKLKDAGFDEVRVHLGATNFSAEVYNNLKRAVKLIPVVTIETPAWPPHTNKLFEMLPIIQEIGVKHLNICQIEVTHKKQLDNIEKALGTINLYQAFYPVLDDEGLVEGIMNEVLKRSYSFSVLDCNGFVKQSRSAISNQSYWSILNRRYPPEWEKQRYQRKLKEAA
jgi:pyruvate formate-lyase activating enzyme-like uncharacterized protein